MALFHSPCRALDEQRDGACGIADGDAVNPHECDRTTPVGIDGAENLDEYRCNVG